MLTQSPLVETRAPHRLLTSLAILLAFSSLSACLPRPAGRVADTASQAFNAESYGRAQVAQACGPADKDQLNDMASEGTDIARALCGCVRDALPGEGQWCDADRRLREWRSLYGQLFANPASPLLKQWGASDPNLCATYMAEHHLYYRVLDRLLDQCRAGDPRGALATLRDMSPASIDDGKAWRFDRLDTDGCVIAVPRSPGAAWSRLPITSPKPGLANAPTRLCDERLSTIHRIKDPDNKTAPSPCPCCTAFLGDCSPFPAPTERLTVTAPRRRCVAIS